MNVISAGHFSDRINNVAIAFGIMSNVLAQFLLKKRKDERTRYYKNPPHLQVILVIAEHMSRWHLSLWQMSWASSSSSLMKKRNDERTGYYKNAILQVIIAEQMSIWHLSLWQMSCHVSGDSKHSTRAPFQVECVRSYFVQF